MYQNLIPHIQSTLHKVQFCWFNFSDSQIVTEREKKENTALPPCKPWWQDACRCSLFYETYWLTPPEIPGTLSALQELHLSVSVINIKLEN